MARKSRQDWMLRTSYDGGEPVYRAFSWIYRNAHRVTGISYTTQHDGSADVTFFLDNNRTLFRGHYASSEAFEYWHNRSRTFGSIQLFHVPTV